jgi:DnaK suppressor protein
MFTDLFRFWGLAKPVAGVEKQEKQEKQGKEYQVTKVVKQPKKEKPQKQTIEKKLLKASLSGKKEASLKEGKKDSASAVAILTQDKEKTKKSSAAMVKMKTAKTTQSAHTKTRVKDNKKSSIVLKSLDPIKKQKKILVSVASAIEPVPEIVSKTKKIKRTDKVVKHEEINAEVSVPAPKTAVTVLQPKAKKTVRSGTLVAPSMENIPVVASTAAKAIFQQVGGSNYPGEEPVLNLEKRTKKDTKRTQNWKKLPLEALTEADIEAMPDDEYMNDTQLAFFRLHLLRLKQGILENAGHTTEYLREDSLVVPDPTDRATIEEEHAFELRTRDRERKLLKKIDQAIGRIDQRDYGYCDETGEPIGLGRLLARPTATLSLEAQQRREMKQRLFGDEAN